MNLEDLSDEELEAMLAESERYDPRQVARGMRPETRDDEPSGPVKREAQFRSISPAKEREVGHQVRQIRQGKPGSGGPDETAAKDFVRETSDPMEGGAIDPIAMQVMAGPIGMVAGRVAGALPGMRGVLAGGGRISRPIAGAVQGATEASAANTAAGGSPTDPVALLLGGAGRAGGKFAEAARAPGSRTGRAIRNIEAAGGKPGAPLGRPARGGMFDEAEYRDLPEGPAGTEKIAREAEGKINENFEARRAAAREGLDEVEGQVSADSGTKPLNQSRTIGELEAIRDQNMGGDGPTIPEADAMLGGAIQQLRGANTRASATPSILRRGVPTNTFDELRNLHKALNQRAQSAQTTGDLAGAAATQAAGAVRRATRAADKRMGPALDAYGDEMGKLSEANDLLYASDGPVAPDRATKAGVATAKIKQVGKETDTAARAETDLRGVEALDPVAATQIPRVRGHNAATAIDYTLNPGGATPFNVAANLLRRNADAASVRIGMPLGDFANQLTNPQALGPAFVLMNQTKPLEAMTDEELAAELAKMDTDSSRGRKKQGDARR